MSPVRVHSLQVYPIKSCKAIDVNGTAVEAAGLARDREWMVVDAHGAFITQRRYPVMARISCRLTDDTLQVFHENDAGPTVPLSLVGTNRMDVTVWGDRCPAHDAGNHAADWFSSLLGEPVRLVRFADGHLRPSDASWTGEVSAPNRFSDGFPILVTNTASLEYLNQRIGSPVPMNRFRPNIVLEGLEAFDEDHIRAVRIGDLELRLVKPCTRCEITTTDQATGGRGAEPLRTLTSFRSDPRMAGGITFGMNAIALGPLPLSIATGAHCEIEWTM